MVAIVLLDTNGAIVPQLDARLVVEHQLSQLHRRQQQQRGGGDGGGRLLEDDEGGWAVADVHLIEDGDEDEGIF